MTVGKKDGGVRICIDFRAINNVTQPDLYQMPLIEEILETLASARFISKIDLNKGFHQILIQQWQDSFLFALGQIRILRHALWP